MTEDEANFQAARERLERRRAEIRAQREQPRNARVPTVSGEQRIRRRVHSDPVAVENLLSRLKRSSMRPLFATKKPPLERAREAWAQVVPDEFAQMLSVSSFRGTTLTVAVTSAALKQELESFHRESLLESLKTRPGMKRVDRLVFRLA